MSQDSSIKKESIEKDIRLNEIKKKEGKRNP